MCIRDRTSGQGSATAAYTVGDWEWAIRHGVGPDGRGLVITVSYTHLRAHETVLDLVCRLLLEKKKTPKTLTLSRHQRATQNHIKLRHTMCTTVGKT